MLSVVGQAAPAQGLPQWVVTSAAGRVLTGVWKESIVTRRERVACLAGRLERDTVWIEGARLLPLDDADSLTVSGERSIAECKPPAWLGSAHTHVRSTDDSAPAPRFSAGDRMVMSLWSQRWARQGAFCVLYGEGRAHCELYPPRKSAKPSLRRAVLPAQAVLAQSAAPVDTAAADSILQNTIPEAARLRPGVPFDPAAATAAYLATVPPDKRARSDAYFEGGYWIQLWGFLIIVGIMLLLLNRGWSRRMRDWAERRTRRRWIQAFLYYVGFTVIVTVLTFPFAIYTSFVREHQYGLATESFGGWLRDQLVALGVSLVLGGVAVTIMYGVLRRFPRRWPVVATGTAIAFVVVAAAIAPVFIAPLFNKYTLLTDARIRDPILRLARANGVAADKVYVVDASRQSTRISANVSGLLGTQRIALNDNLLRRTSPAEIEAVMGHEMGHYVLRHIPQLIIFLALLIVAGAVFLRAGFAWAAGRWGEQWGVRGIEDPAGLPVLALLLSAYFFALTPATNTYIRTTEATADIFGLSAARQPDGFALIALKLGEYRKLDPGPVEEFIFFDHPSGRARIRMAMEWKGES
jgi:STE24 endopeptidase